MLKSQSSAAPVHDTKASRLIYEMQVQKIELELQNQQLTNAHDIAEQIAARYTELYNFAPVGYLTLSRNGNITQANLVGAQLLGSQPEKLIGIRIGVFIARDSIPVFNKFLQQSFVKGTPVSSQLELRINGQIRVVQIDASLSDDRNECRAILTDITKRLRDEAKLRLAANVFTHASEGIFITDSAGIIIEVNDAFSLITGYSRDEILGKHPRIFKSEHQSPDFYRAMWKYLQTNDHWSGEVDNSRRNGEVYTVAQTLTTVRDASDKTINFISFFTDITSMKAHQGQLEHFAHYDPLTNLPNRVLLADRLNQAMVQCHRSETSVAVVFLDLDGFKVINDRYGHAAGDALLIAASQRMQAALRKGDTLARIGGDEFIAIVTNLAKSQDSVPELERLLRAAASPVAYQKMVLKVSASIGVTLYPQDNADADILIRHADQAMYLAKESGKNRYHLFDTEQNNAIKIQRKNMDSIRLALKRNEFVLYYQPKVNMRSGEVIGAEALVRWQHPKRGLLAPIEFLPAIEHNPLSISLGEWVIDSALNQISQWRLAGLNLSISVNISAFQLQQVNFISRLKDLLAMHPEVPPRSLELEVLETNAISDMTQMSSIMQACILLGVNFALDDFGTGYSSLDYLRRLPANLIKIDKTFVQDMLNDSEDMAIVVGVVGLANAFHRQVIAEGVESLAHGRALLNIGCELAQGYSIARPMPVAKFPHWIKHWSPDKSWQVASGHH